MTRKFLVLLAVVAASCGRDPEAPVLFVDRAPLTAAYTFQHDTRRALATPLGESVDFDLVVPENPALHFAVAAAVEDVLPAPVTFRLLVDGAPFSRPKCGALDRTAGTITKSPVSSIVSEFIGQGEGGEAPHLYAVREGPLKLIVGASGDERLFDLGRDPVEETALPDGEAKQRLRAALEAYRLAAAEAVVDGNEITLSDAIREELKALGYLEQ